MAVQVFFTPDAWPDSLVPELRPVMQDCYSQCQAIAAAVLHLFAAALGVQHDYFDDKTCWQHSNLQVSTYSTAGAAAPAIMLLKEQTTPGAALTCSTGGLCLGPPVPAQH